MANWEELLIASLGSAADTAVQQAGEEISWLRKTSLAQLEAKSGKRSLKGNLREADVRALTDLQYLEETGKVPEGTYNEVVESGGADAAALITTHPRFASFLTSERGRLENIQRIETGEAESSATLAATIDNLTKSSTTSELTSAAKSLASSMINMELLPANFDVESLDSKTSVENFMNRPEVKAFSAGLQNTMQANVEGRFGLPEELGSQATRTEQSRLETRSSQGTDALAGELSAVQQSAEQRISDELQLAEREGSAEGRRMIAERDVTREDPRGSIVTMINPNNTNETIQVREGSTDATALAENGWVPSSDVSTFQVEQGRQARQIGNTIQIQKEGRWVDADEFYGRTSGDSPDILRTSGGNRRVDPGDPIVAAQQETEVGEAIDTILSEPERLRESVPTNLRRLGYEYVNSDLVPNFDPIDAGIGLWDAGAKDLINRIPGVGHTAQAISAENFGEASAKAKIMFGRLINTVRKISSVAEIRPGMWDQMLALREAADSGIFQTEERAVSQFEAMGVEARRLIEEMVDVINDPTSHISDVREARNVIKNSERILGLTENMLFAHELHNSTIPINGRDLRIGNLSEEDLDNVLSYINSYYKQRGELPEGFTPRKLVLLSFYEKQMMGRGGR